jgi:hypothetical protein
VFNFRGRSTVEPVGVFNFREKVHSQAIWWLQLPEKKSTASEKEYRRVLNSEIFVFRGCTNSSGITA